MITASVWNDAIVEHGPEYGFEVEALNASPNGMADVTGYIEATEALAQKNIDAILCQPLFSVPDMLMQFQQKDVKVGFVNIVPQISDSSKDLDFCYAGSSEEAIGAQLGGIHVFRLEGWRENLCYLSAIWSGQRQAGRLKGLQDWFAANRPDIEILEVNYVERNEATLAQSIFEDWIQKYGVGGFDGVATQSSMQTQGIVESMKALGLNNTNFILGGISASSSDWIKEGTEYCDLYQDPDLEATTALDMMRHMVDGTTNELEFLDGAPTKNFVNVPMTTLNADNADEYTSDALQQGKQSPLLYIKPHARDAALCAASQFVEKPSCALSYNWVSIIFRTSQKQETEIILPFPYR